MKKLYAIIISIVIAAGVFAQSPDKMSYQAVIRNSVDGLVTNTSIGMQISILQGSSAGTPVYVETQTPATNANGLVSIEIGAGTTSDDFSAINWADGPFFIKTETDIDGGINYSITGVSQLLSVPYALHAKTAESISGGVTETDPIFGSSVASGITGTDTTGWNSKLDSYTETDPIFGSSVASGITGSDTTGWNNKPDSYTETDPIFGSSVAGGITGTDTTNWNGKLDEEVDGSVTNEIQNIQSILTEGNDAGLNNIVNIGHLTIGSSTLTPGAALEINTTNGAFLLPRITTAQRDALTFTKGLMIYNTDEDKFQGCIVDSSSSPVLDQQQPTVNNGGGENRAQSFTAGLSGSLSAIELPLNASMGTYNVNVTIREGDGTSGSVLHTQTFAIPEAGITWYTFDITGVDLVAGNSYTIHVTEVSPCGMPPCYFWGMTTSDSYPGGVFYYDDTPWSGGIYDCAFKTYILIEGDSWVDLN